MSTPSEPDSFYLSPSLKCALVSSPQPDSMLGSPQNLHPLCWFSLFWTDPTDSAHSCCDSPMPLARQVEEQGWFSPATSPISLALKLWAKSFNMIFCLLERKRDDCSQTGKRNHLMTTFTEEDVVPNIWRLFLIALLGGPFVSSGQAGTGSWTMRLSFSEDRKWQHKQWKMHRHELLILKKA